MYNRIVSMFGRNTVTFYRRAVKAERQLKRLEDKVTFENVKLEGGKTQLMREEPKDFSRIIAANLTAESREKIGSYRNLTLLSGITAAKIISSREAKVKEKEAELVQTKGKLATEKSKVKVKKAELNQEKAKARLQVMENKLKGEFEKHEEVEKKLEFMTKYSISQHMLLNKIDESVKERCGDDVNCIEDYEKMKKMEWDKIDQTRVDNSQSEGNSVPAPSNRGI